MSCEDDAEQSTAGQVIFLSITAVLVLLSGLFSGLNLGLMSFTDDDLRVVIEGSSDPNEVKNAKRIRPLRQRGNLLLCTLLLGNTLVNAMIAILLSDIAEGVVGGLVTTALIVIFGEITPQSVCSRYALAVGAKSVPIVWLFLIICFPIAYPISIILDWVLGREMGGVYSRGELVALITMNASDPERAKETGLDEQDAKLLKGALGFRHRSCSDIMTPIEDVFTLSIDAVLDKPTVMELLERGHERVPVHDGRTDNIVAIFYCRDVIGVGWERKMPVKDVIQTYNGASRVHQVASSTNARDAYMVCKNVRRHLLIVTDDQPYKTSQRGPAIGLVTLEDIIEEIFQEEIVGEQDQYVDSSARMMGKTNSKRPDPKVLLKRLTSHRPDDGLVLPGAVCD